MPSNSRFVDERSANDRTEIRLVSGDDVISIGAFEFCLLDGERRAVQPRFRRRETAFSGDRLAYELEVMFPEYSRTIAYDPDVTVLLGAAGGGGGDPWASSYYLTIWILSLTLVGVALVLAVVVLLLYLKSEKVRYFVQGGSTHAKNRELIRERRKNVAGTSDDQSGDD